MRLSQGRDRPGCCQLTMEASQPNDKPIEVKKSRKHVKLHDKVGDQEILLTIDPNGIKMLARSQIIQIHTISLVQGGTSQGLKFNPII